MKKTGIIILAMVFGFSTVVPAYASDWDKAGKVLTGLAGLRLLSGGKIDLVGTLFGMDQKDRSYHAYKTKPQHKKNYHKKYRKRKKYCYHKVWVPHYEWRREYVPRHEEYDKHHNKIIIEGHYIKYRVEDGGHWEHQTYCG